MGEGRINKSEKMDIFGSCVTRDVFTYDNEKEITLGEYIARQSILTVFSSPLCWKEEEMGKICSDFQKRMLRNDFEKSTFDKLRTSKGNYIVVDLIDERFHLAKVQNTYLTYSTELMISEYLERKKYKKIDKRNWLNRDVLLKTKEKIGRFAEELEKIYGVGRIILHRVMLKDEYVDKNGDIKRFPKQYLEDNKRINDYLSYMYDELAGKILKPYMIDVTDLYYADERNKWGLATMHYQEEYYVDVLMKIKKIIYENNTNINCLYKKQ